MTRSFLPWWRRWLVRARSPRRQSHRDQRGPWRQRLFLEVLEELEYDEVANVLKTHNTYVGE